MRWKQVAVALLMVLIFAGAAGFGAALYSAMEGRSSGGAGTAAAAPVAQAPPEGGTVRILPAQAVIGQVSASGNIALSSEHYVVLNVAGTYNEIYVKPGDRVQAGDLLLTLDIEELERAVKRAELSVQSQFNEVEQLEEETSAAELAAGQANLASAMENLAQVRAGPSSEEIAAARSTLSAAQAEYADLQAGPSETELTQLSADLRKAEIALQEAQTEYDKVAWLNSVGMTSQSSTLQQASIDHEAAQAAYAEATAPASNAELQTALSSIQTAQKELDDLLAQPTQVDLMNAEAQVAEAQAALDDLQGGASGTELRNAQIALEQALVDLQEAYVNLDYAKVNAPIDGTVLAVDAKVGQQGSAGTSVVTLADTTQLELTINVAEADISQVAEGQAVEVTIDALPGETFHGEVVMVAPTSDESADIVNYPVTVQLATDQSLAKVRPGMTAVATLTGADEDAPRSSGWLAPTNAIHTVDGVSSVTVVRGDAQLEVQVTPGAVQGEWTVVESPELQLGDAVVGSVTSQLDEDEPRFGPGGGFRPGGGGGGGRPGEGGQ